MDNFEQSQTEPQNDSAQPENSSTASKSQSLDSDSAKSSTPAKTEESAPAPNNKLNLVFSIIAIVFWPVAVVSLPFSIQEYRYYRFDPDQRPTSSTVSLTLSILAAALLIGTFIYLLFLALIIGGLSEAFNS
jgi:hypothetical protein